MCRLPGPGEHGKNGARHAKRIDTRRPRAGLLRGRHPRRLALAVRPGLEGPQGPVPPVPRRRGGLRGARRGDRRGRGAGLRRDGGDVVLRGGPHQAPRVAGDARARGALPGEDAEEAPGAGEVRRGGRGEGRPRGDVRLKARDPQEPGRVGRRGALHARGALRGGEGADLGDQHREVAAHHRAGRAQVEVPRHGRAEADGGAPLRARRGRAALGALADLWAAARDAALDMELAIEASLEENCPALLAMYGCGPVSAAKLAVAAGDNPGRLRSEASFAAICGACPIPASSGKTVRHRLNRGGDRQANSALHEIARQRVMRDPETAEYAERARGRGKSDREVMRCLKRYVAREAYRALMRPHEIRRPEDASELMAARRAAKVSQVRAASILGTSEKYISMLERGQRELKPIRRAYEAWVEAGLPLDWDRQAFEAERKMDSKKHLAK